MMLHEVDLHVLAAPVVEVVRAFLRDDRARRVMGVDDADAVLDAGFLDDGLHLLGEVVEAGLAVAGLELDFAVVD